MDSLFGLLKETAHVIRGGAALRAACIDYDPGMWANTKPDTPRGEYRKLAESLAATDDRLFRGKPGHYCMERVWLAQEGK